MKSSDKHEKIIRAAVKVFAKKGFFSARISDIAKAAKVADGTIYLYFNNKTFSYLFLTKKSGSLLLKQKNLLIRKKPLKRK
jgi:TetR/AcrR family fatty acid metabolism transcriptional regulator